MLVVFHNFTFPANTPLYPSYNYIQEYHAAFAKHNHLYDHIRLNHSVESAEWRGNSTSGHWNVTVQYPQHKVQQHWYPFHKAKHERASASQTFRIDHLVVAVGHYHYPNVPSWPGQKEWLGASPDHEMLHSIYYRRPEAYSGRTVLIVGGGASGRDIASQIGPLSRKVSTGLQVHLQPSSAHSVC